MDICNILAHFSPGVLELSESHERYQQCSLIMFLLNTLVVHLPFSTSPCYHN